MAWFVTLHYSANNWAQTGYIIGTLNTSSTTTRAIYWEFNVNNDWDVLFDSGHTIPNNDNGYMEVWQSSYSGGNYYATGKVYMTNGTAFSRTYNMGPNNANGNAYHETEAIYAGTYNGNCSVYSQYSTSSGLKYTTSVGTEPKTGGTNCGTSYSSADTNYNVQLVSGCNNSINFWGG
jgi:hypothetical protein